MDELLSGGGAGSFAAVRLFDQRRVSTQLPGRRTGRRREGSLATRQRRRPRRRDLTEQFQYSFCFLFCFFSPLQSVIARSQFIPLKVYECTLGRILRGTHTHTHTQCIVVVRFVEHFRSSVDLRTCEDVSHRWLTSSARPGDDEASLDRIPFVFYVHKQNTSISLGRPDRASNTSVTDLFVLVPRRCCTPRSLVRRRITRVLD